MTTLSFFSLVFAVFPYLIDSIGVAFGVAYPPTLLLLVAIIALVVKALLGDIALTKVHRDVRRLNQRMALFDLERPQAPQLEQPVAEALREEIRRGENRG